MTSEECREYRRVKIKLRSLFVYMFYLAVGLAVGARVTEQPTAFGTPEIDPVFVDWHYTFLVVATFSVAVSLASQARTIAGSKLGATIKTQQRFGLQLEAGWRAIVSVGLLLQVLLQLSISRGYFTPPATEFTYFSTPSTTIVWWVLLFLPVAEAALRDRRARKRGALRQLLDALAWGAMLCLLIYLTIDRGLISFLVHVACRGVDATLAYTGNRYLIVTADLEWRIVVLAGAAVVAAISAGILFVQAFGRRIRPMTSLCLCAAAIALLTAAGSYCIWYYTEALPRLSPDLLLGMPGASWFDLLGGVMLTLTIVTAAAIRLVRRASIQSRGHDLAIEAGAGAETLPALLSLAGASGFIFAVTVISSLNSKYLPPGRAFAYAMIYYPDTTFSAAIFLLSAYLLWRRRRHPTPPPLLITSIEPRRFLAAWLAMAATLVVTVPTLAALSISYWLGPWYRW